MINKEDRAWMFFENIGVLAIIIPILSVFVIIVCMFAYDKYSSWSANRSLNEFSDLAYNIERETNFIIKIGDEIKEIRNYPVCKYCDFSREIGANNAIIRDSCGDLWRAIRSYNRVVQPAYSIIMSDPISMQIHKEINPLANEYCEESGYL